MVGGVAPVLMPRVRWRQTLPALAHREYRTLWIAAMISNLGNWIQNVAKAWLVYELSGQSAFWLGVEAFALHMPAAMLTPFMGVVSDRFDRRNLLMGSTLIGGLFAVVLAALYFTDLIQVWHIVAVSVFYGIAEAMRLPAYISLMPQLVGPRDVPNAVALNSIQFNLSRIIGPAIGGIVLVQLGAGVSFLLNAATFFAMLFMLGAIASRPSEADRAETFFQSMRAGVKYLADRRDLRVMLGLTLLAGVTCSPAMTMLPALVEAVFAQGAAGFSAMLTAFGLGALVGGAMLVVRSHRGPTPWRAFLILFLMGLCQIGLALSTDFRLSVALVFASGLAFVGAMNRLFAAISASTPNHVRGRVGAFNVLAFRGGIPVGALLAGWIADGLSVQAAFAVAGVVLVTLVTVLMIEARRKNASDHFDRAMSHADPSRHAPTREARS